MKKWVLGAAGIAGTLLIAASAYAVLGVGDTVFDPTMYAQQTLMFEEQTQQVEEETDRTIWFYQ